MITWSQKTYATVTVAFAAGFYLGNLYLGLDIAGVMLSIAEYVAVLSVALIVFPLVAVPLMMQILEYARAIGEAPTSELYRDFNAACLLVSMGSLFEIILLFLVVISARSHPGIGVVLASLALANLIAFMLIFALVVLLLQKITNELEEALTSTRAA